MLLATIFLFPVPPIPTGVSILVLALIFTFAAVLASPVFLSIAALIGDDTACETDRQK